MPSVNMPTRSRNAFSNSAASPTSNPASLLQRSASQYAEGKSLSDMIKEDLIAERIVIEVYQKMIRHFGDHDPTTRVMIERHPEGRRRTRQPISPTCCSSPIPAQRRDPRARIRARIRWTCTGTSSRASSAATTSKVKADAGRTNRPLDAEQGDAEQFSQASKLHAPRIGRAGHSALLAAVEPSRRNQSWAASANREGVGNLVSGDKTLMESPERGKIPSVAGSAHARRQGKMQEQEETRGVRTVVGSSVCHVEPLVQHFWHPILVLPELLTIV